MSVATEVNASVAALATEVKAEIEKGFGTWKVKLKVNMPLFCVPPVDGSNSRQSATIKENKVNRERWGGEESGQAKRSLS